MEVWPLKGVTKRMPTAIEIDSWCRPALFKNRQNNKQEDKRGHECRLYYGKGHQRQATGMVWTCSKVS